MTDVAIFWAGYALGFIAGLGFFATCWFTRGGTQ